MAFVYKLLNKLKPKCIVVGEDFKFGNARHGDIKQLKHYFNVKAVKINKKYKTTNIKQHIINGNISFANKLLVDPYMITGIVQRGKQLGRKLGYPTANINLPKNTIQPKMGSYKAYTYVNGIKYPSAVFIRNYLLETHIFNFNKNIYDKVISIQLIQYHRSMNKVNNFTSLQKVIDSKVKSIKSTF
jgi:riboflavin kinase/FMN adenylyltransferase